MAAKKGKKGGVASADMRAIERFAPGGKRDRYGGMGLALPFIPTMDETTKALTVGASAAATMLAANYSLPKLMAKIISTPVGATAEQTATRVAIRAYSESGLAVLAGLGIGKALDKVQPQVAAGVAAGGIAYGIVRIVTQLIPTAKLSSISVEVARPEQKLFGRGTAGLSVEIPEATQKLWGVRGNSGKMAQVIDEEESVLLGGGNISILTA